LIVLHVESSYFDTDMCKFQSSQKDESRAQWADSPKTHRKPNSV